MATMRHLRLHATNLTNKESVLDKQEIHRNKREEEVTITFIVLDVSDDTYAAGKRARALLGTEWRLEIHHEIRGSHDRDFILV